MATTRWPLAHVTVPAKCGRGLLLERGQRLKVIAEQGPQVGDLFAYMRHSLDETLSPSQTRTRLGKFSLEVGQPLYSIRSRPLFILERDTVGVHDLLAPACDTMRYLRDFGIPAHPSCRRNLYSSLRQLGYSPPGYPDPVNLFQNTPIVDLEGTRETRESLAKPGDYVLLRAVEDLIAVVSACPQDQTKLNGRQCKELVLEIYG